MSEIYVKDKATELKDLIEFLNVSQEGLQFMSKWSKELRGTDLPQGKGVLCSLNEFCCLGIAGLVAGAPIENKEAQLFGYNYLPEFFSNLNDQDLLTFKDIADVIDAALNLLEEENHES